MIPTHHDGLWRPVVPFGEIDDMTLSEGASAFNLKQLNATVLSRTKRI